MTTKKPTTSSRAKLADLQRQAAATVKGSVAQPLRRSRNGSGPE